MRAKNIAPSLITPKPGSICYAMASAYKKAASFLKGLAAFLYRLYGHFNGGGLESLHKLWPHAQHNKACPQEG